MHSSHRFAAALLSVLLAAPGTASAAAQETHFTDESLAYGVLFQHSDQPSAYSMGGGAAWLDFDVDGDEDLLAISSDGRHSLFERDGASFTDVALQAGLLGLGTHSAIGVIVADYDQDGLPDAYLTCSGPNKLLTNLGTGAFQDDAPALGVAGTKWSSCSAWSDFDRDGDLDLYVGNYVVILQFPYHYGETNDFYENQGTSAAPVFVERAAELGVGDDAVFGPSVPGYPFLSPEGQATAGCTLSISTTDWDEDGDPDLGVGNDFGQWVTPNRLYRNDTPAGGALVFTDVSQTTAFDTRPHYNMGVNWADYDHDGDWDVYMTNLGDNVLLRNDDGVFTDQTYAAGPVDGLNEAGSLLLSSWGTVWGDFDNDLWEDLFVVNGLIPAATFIENEPLAPNHLWMNNGDGTFWRVDPPTSGLDDTGGGRGVAPCDIDGNGLLDLYVMNNGSPWVAKPGDACRLFVNQGSVGTGGTGGAANHWVALRLEGWQSNLEGLGSRLEAHVPGHVLKRQLTADPVSLSGASRSVHFGLGPNAALERLVVEWPRGLHQELWGLPADHEWDVREPRVTVEEVLPPSWDGNVLHLPARLTNQLAAATTATVVYWFQLPAPSGAFLLSIPTAETLQPHETRDVEFAIPLDTQLHSLLQGIQLDLRVYASQGGAHDSRALGFAIP